MTQPIDVAYVEIVPLTKDFKRELSKETSDALKDVEKQTKATTAEIEKSFKEAGEAASGSFRDANGRLRDTNGRFLKMGEDATEALEGVGKAAAGAAAGGLAAVQRALVSIFGGVGQLAAAGPAGIAILAGAFVVLAGAVAAAAAVVQQFINIAVAGIGLLPGVIGAAIAGFGILQAALSGVSEAFKEESEASTQSAGVSINNARRVADAQRQVLQAQKDLIQARIEEKERIQDVNRELIASRVAEKRATMNVAEAEFALEQARKRGDTRAIAEAKQRVDEAKSELAGQKDRTEDLAAEKAKADKLGVEGSDRVQRALEAVRDAQDALAASQERVSAGAAAQKRAIDSLSQSAQDFVRALIAAKNELKPLQQAIQESFFRGTAPLIDPIVENIKDLEPEILRVSDAFNKIFKEILIFLGSDEAKDAFSGILGGLATFLEKITPAIRPLLEAFGGLAGDSEDVAASLGDGVAGALMDIAEFIKDVDLKKLFDDAKKALDILIPLLGPLVSIFKDLFSILASLGNLLLPSLAGNFMLLADALKFVDDTFSPLFQKIFDFILLIRKDPKEAFEVFKTAVKDGIQGAADAFDNFLTNISNGIDDIKKWIKDLPENLKKFGPKFLEAGKKMIAALFEGLGAAGGFLTDIGKQVANSIIRFLNRSVIGTINDSIKGLQEAINKLPLIGDVSLPQIPNIPQLAKGGLSTKNTLAEISEGNKAEAVLPLENARAMAAVGEAISRAGGLGGGGHTINFGQGSVVVTFQGVIPSQQEAFTTGQAVGRGIAEAVARRNINLAVRTM